MEAANLNHLWANLIVAELIRYGVRTFVIAPGSRSAPLATAAFRNKQASIVTHFDERGASFFALGCGRMGNPAAVICTSGSAVANCLPAVVEASYSALPLIILSADRPPELQGCAANQTMDQGRVFSAYVRACLELPCPDVLISPEAVLTKVDAVLATGLHTNAGPVHINCMFREPLAPVPVADAWPKSYLSGLAYWETHGMPFTHWEPTARTISETQCMELVAILSSSRKGLILIGRLHSLEEQASALRLAKRLGWPVFADITSGCRDREECGVIVHHYDLLLRSSKFREFCAPDMILHLGDVFVSKHLQEHLQHMTVPYIQISTRQENRDAVWRVTRRYVSDIPCACRTIECHISERPPHSFLNVCLEADHLVEAQIKRLTKVQTALKEVTIARLVDGNIPPEMALLLGNSMPIRDMDMFSDQNRCEVVHANRGVSGIDGNIALAAGMQHSAAKGVVAVIGDMAVLHDLNSLALISSLPFPMFLIIVNNQGGGIFSFLPVAAHTDILDPCFINSHSWRFEQAARMFGIPYERVDTAEAFRDAFQQATLERTTRIIEASVEREANIQAHTQCYREIIHHVERYFEGLRFS